MIGSTEKINIVIGRDKSETVISQTEIFYPCADYLKMRYYGWTHLVKY